MFNKKSVLIVLCCLLVCIITGNDVTAEMNKMVWQNAGHGMNTADLHFVAGSISNSKEVYAGSDKVVYKTLNEGRTWEEVFSLRGSDKIINELAVSPVRAGHICAAISEGLYCSYDGGVKWEKIFSGIRVDKKNVLSAAFGNTGGVLYAGTGKGLFVTDDNEKSWKKIDGIPADSRVSRIKADAKSPDILYVVTNRGLFKSIDSGINWQAVYRTKYRGNDIEDLYENGTGEGFEDIAGSEISDIAVAPGNSNVLYAAISGRVIVSRDGGAGWKALNSAGLLSRELRGITVAPDGTLYAATGSGVFRSSGINSRWEELYDGLFSDDVRQIVMAGVDSPQLWAATGKGIFRLAKAAVASAALNADDALQEFPGEPTIGELREVAIEYAGVSPDKIKAWSRSASRKAILPDVRLAYQNGNDWQSSTYFYSSTKEKYKDDDVTEGDDKVWSVSMTWELGDLIWNNDQTSIDSRSRMLVQLREDILGELTRLYFERRRLQTEINISPSSDAVEKIDRELRLQELTANIDSLTGSYLSKRVKAGLIDQVSLKEN